MATLSEQVQQRAGEFRRLGIHKGPRCVPQCDSAQWADLAPQKGTIETYCRRCGTWIGNRTTGGKMAAPAHHGDTESTEHV